MKKTKLLINLFLISLGLLTLPSFAIELNSGNVASFGCSTSATLCSFTNQSITSIESGVFINHTNLQTIYLGANQISSIEDGAFSGLISLQTLELNNNQISSIEDGAFSGLISLQTLNLATNQISNIESGIVLGLNNLQQLDLRVNQITNIKGGNFANLNSLTYLNIAGNQISSIESGAFVGLNNLITLVLTNSYLTGLVEGTFAGLGNVTTLGLGSLVPLKHIETKAFYGLSKLTTIDLSNKGIESIESGAFLGLDSMTYLPLYDNNLTGLVEGTFAGLNNVTMFSLNRNYNLKTIETRAFDGLEKITSLTFNTRQIYPNKIESGAFLGLSGLQTLNLRNNELTGLVEGTFAGLNNVTSLELYPAQPTIKFIEKNAFGGLDKLTSLGLGYMGIESIESGAFLGLGLTYLNMAGNQIVLIQSGIFSGLGGLTSLNLSNNQISGELNGGLLNGLNNLTAVDLHGNNFTEININTFSLLTGLVTIDISENQIKRIPSGTFVGLNNLTEIYLQKNIIEEIENRYDFHDLGNLYYLVLSRNKIKKLPSTRDWTPTMIDYGYDDFYLGLSNNQIINIPSTWSGMNNNVNGAIGLHKNYIVDIPEIVDGYPGADLNINDNCLGVFRNLTSGQIDFLDGYDGAYDIEWTVQRTGSLCPIYTEMSGTINNKLVEISGFVMTGTIEGIIYQNGDPAFDLIVEINGEEYIPSINSGIRTITGVILTGGNYPAVLRGEQTRWSSDVIDSQIEQTGTLGINIGTSSDIQSPEVSGVENGRTYTTSATFSISDNVGVNSVTLDGESLTERTNVTVTEIGAHTLVAKDAADNTTTVSFTIKKKSSGGGGGTIQKDNCPNGDNSSSYYDSKCEKVQGEQSQEKEKTKAKYTAKEEMKKAYEFAKEKKITTTKDIEEFDVEGKLIRMHLAKMISEFATEVMGKTEQTGATVEGCSEFEDMAGETEEMKKYVTMACKLGLMGRNGEQTAQQIKFNPNIEVNRAQFGTILSRLLRGQKYAAKVGASYYGDHLQALKASGIMTLIEPEMEELRGWVALMLYRVGGNK